MQKRNSQNEMKKKAKLPRCKKRNFQNKEKEIIHHRCKRGIPKMKEKAKLQRCKRKKEFQNEGKNVSSVMQKMEFPKLRPPPKK